MLQIFQEKWAPSSQKFLSAVIAIHIIVAFAYSHVLVVVRPKFVLKLIVWLVVNWQWVLQPYNVLSSVFIMENALLLYLRVILFFLFSLAVVQRNVVLFVVCSAIC